MGRIKELQEKTELTDVEQKELDELLSEAKDVQSEVKEEVQDVEKDIDDAAKMIADKAIEQAESRLSKSIDEIAAKLGKGLEIADDAKISVKSPKYIIDSKLGKKTVAELEDIKVELPMRKSAGKKVTEVSQKTVNFVQAWLTGDHQKLQVLVEGTGARGGFLVPDDYANMLVEDIRDVSIMRSIADVMTTTSDTLHLPNLASRPQASFRAEGAVKSTSTVGFGENVFTPYSLATIIPLSNELVADATLGVNGNIVNKVSELAAQALSEREERAFWQGSGTGEPTGMSTYGVGTMSGGLTDTTRADALISTYFRLPQGYRNKAVWVMNSQTMEKVRKLKDNDNNYLLGSVTGSPMPTILGRPVYECDWVAAGTAYFGDFSYYVIVDREGIQVDTSSEATVASQSAFERNLTFVRVEKRVDAELTLTNGIRSVTSLGTI